MHAMRHRTLLGSALHANVVPLCKGPAQPPTIFFVLPKTLPHTKTTSTTRYPYPRRSYSSASPSPQQQPPSTTPPIPAPAITTSLSGSSTTTATTTTTATKPPSPTANPPSTTRPPPLTLPPRPAEAAAFFSQANFHYLFARGVAYLAFYKTSLWHVVTNTRLLYASSKGEEKKKTIGDVAVPTPGTRSHIHLRLRWRHDVRRLPLFAVILAVCGEFTPLVVLALPRAVPLPCRVPRQVEKILEGDEALRREGRREVAFADGAAVEVGGEGVDGGVGVGVGNVSGSEGEGERERERTVDTVGKVVGERERKVVMDAALAKILGVTVRRWTSASGVAARVQERLGFLAVDDALLLQEGGAEVLIPEEVRLACADRGIDVLGRSDDDVRVALARWLRLTDVRRVGEEGREQAVLRLLTTADSKWEA